MDPADQLWLALQAVRSVEFTAAGGGPNPWVRTGTGSVRVEVSAADRVTFYEAGSWRHASASVIRFRTVLRWSRLANGWVNLEHLRLGPGRPVPLVQFALSAPDRWHAVTPHSCEADLYDAELRLGAGQVVLRWRITGPEKRDEICAVYRDRALLRGAESGHLDRPATRDRAPPASSA